MWGLGLGLGQRSAENLPAHELNILVQIWHDCRAKDLVYAASREFFQPLDPVLWAAYDTKAINEVLLKIWVTDEFTIRIIWIGSKVSRLVVTRGKIPA
jgi:hypothetical protein